MADIESPAGHADPKTSFPDVPETSHSVNGAQINDAVGSHPQGSMTTGLPWKGDGNTTPNPITESPEKIIASITAAAADREIAHQVWMNSSERDDEVRDALNHMMGWVDKLASLLHTTFTAKAELETTLTVTQSNLALALSNTEMLEEALKRDASGRRADVGWARSSAPVSYSSPATAPLPANPNAGSTANAPMTKSETGFFKFLRNGTGARTPPPGLHHLHRDSGSSAGMHTPHSSLDGPSASTPDLIKHQSHLMSPSLPSLHATSSAVNAPRTSRREEELAQALQRERASTKKVLEEKRNLEEELESLSQALFEEANRMVSTERRQRAQVEEELQTVRQEREALKGALRIVEGENSSLRSEAQGVSAAGRVRHVPPSEASSSSRDRRALTIDTDRAIVQGEAAQGSWIDLSQTPPKLEVLHQLGRHTPTSAVNTRLDVVTIGRSGDVPETGSTLSQSRKTTGESNNSQANGYDQLPRGTLSFGM